MSGNHELCCNLFYSEFGSWMRESVERRILQVIMCTVEILKWCPAQHRVFCDSKTFQNANTVMSHVNPHLNVRMQYAATPRRALIRNGLPHNDCLQKFYCLLKLRSYVNTGFLYVHRMAPKLHTNIFDFDFFAFLWMKLYI